MTVSSVALQPKYHIEVISGINYIKHKPFFSQDHKYLFLLSEHKINIYSTQTGLFLGQIITEFPSTLFSENFKDEHFVAATLHPKYKFQVLTLSNNGNLSLWNYTNGLQIKNYNTGLKGCRNILVTEQRILVVVDNKDLPNKFNVLAFNWPTFNEAHNYESSGQFVAQTIFSAIPFSDRICCRNNSFVAVLFEEAMSIYNFHSYAKKIMSHWPGLDRTFGCITSHPTDDVIATSDNTGRIVLWRNIFESHPIKSIYHWHTLPLGALSFSSNGSYLISGGKECVIVKWNLITDDRQFMPRLEAPISQLTCASDNAKLVVCLENNSIKLTTLNFDQKPLNVSGLLFRDLDTAAAKKYGLHPIGLITDPRTKSLVTNGPTGHLQFLDPWTDVLLCNVDICCQNYHSLTRYGEIVNSDVLRAAFHPSGRYLATFEYRNDGWSNPESYLKIWEFKGDSNSYALNTCLRNPHLEHPLEYLSFQRNFTCIKGSSNGGGMLVSTSSGDRTVKVWTSVIFNGCHNENPDGEVRGGVWRCSHTASHKTDWIPTGAADFSEDDSVIAVGYHNDVVLYDVTDASMLDQVDGESRDLLTFNTALSSPTLREDVTSIKFSTQNKSHYLISTTRHYVLVWNLLDCQVAWMLDVTKLVAAVGYILPLPLPMLPASRDAEDIVITSISCDAVTGNFALFVCDPRYIDNRTVDNGDESKPVSALFTFDPSHPKPLTHLSIPSDLSNEGKGLTGAYVTCSTYLPVPPAHRSEENRGSRLFFLTSRQQLLTLEASSFDESLSLEADSSHNHGLPLPRYDLFDLKSRDDSYIALTPFRALFGRSLKGGLTEASPPTKSTEGITAIKGRVNEIHLALRNCPSHTFPDMKGFSLPYLKCFLNPKPHITHSDTLLKGQSDHGDSRCLAPMEVDPFETKVPRTVEPHQEKINSGKMCSDRATHLNGGEDGLSSLDSICRGIEDALTPKIQTSILLHRAINPNPKNPGHGEIAITTTKKKKKKIDEGIV